MLEYVGCVLLVAELVFEDDCDADLVTIWLGDAALVVDRLCADDGEFATLWVRDGNGLNEYVVIGVSETTGLCVFT